jgi:large subunit ribosomal protein L18
MKIKRRRAEGKTDYRARIRLLKSGKARVVFRKTNRYIIGQYVKSIEAKDKVLVGVNSKELLNYGWLPSYNLKSLPACYLTGFLLGKKVLEKNEKEGIFDIGLIRSIAKSRVYAFLKGIVDAGLKIKHKEEVFPDEKRLGGEHLKNKVEVEEIKQNIERKFV